MSGLTLDHLDEWYSECAIERCSEPGAAALAEQGRIYFSVCMQKVGNPFENPDRRCNDNGSMTARRICWLLLEMRMNTGVHKSGKHYKDWLFEYSSDTSDPQVRLNSVKSGLRLLMQATVRDYCAGLLTQRSRDQRYGVCSFDEIIPGKDGSTPDVFMSKAEYLLQVHDESALQDIPADDVDALAKTIAADMSDRQRVVLLVKWTELNRARKGKISLDHPVILAAAGCGKSRLYAARNGLEDCLKQKIKEVFGRTSCHETDIDPDPVISALVEQIISQMKTEKRFVPFLTFIEEQQKPL